MHDALTPHGLTAEQAALAQALQRLLARDGHLAVTRDFCRGERDAAHALALEFNKFGGPTILVPEHFGGSGLSTVEAALVAHAIGSTCSPLPFAGNLVASRALVLAGNQDQQQAWLAAIARGQCRFAVALRQNPNLTAEDLGLSGREGFLLDGPDCDAVLLRDRDDCLHMVRRQPGLVWTELVTVDLSRRFAQVQIGSAQAQRLHVEAHDLQSLIALERVLVASENLGACESLLDRALAHAQARRQFGRPIGSFQAIKHLCADMAAELDLARSLVWHAAAAHAANSAGAALLCAQAKAHMDEVARVVGRGAIEVHGAMGFAEESDLHLWTKRIAVNRTLAGKPEQLRREVAALHGWLV